MPERRRRRSSARRTVVGLVALACLATATVARAAFSTNTAASHGLSSATLQPASGLTGTTSCNGLGQAKVTLNWTATPSTFATGYTVTRHWGSNPVPESTVSVTPRTTTTLVQTGLSTGTTYTWHLWAVKSNWTSTELTVTKTTPGLCIL
jgi:hypothetical protein